MTREQMAAMLEEGLNEREWFVTGRIDASLFSDEFSFQDDTVTIKGGNGLRRYALGVRQIFDQASSRAQVVGVRVLGDREILVKWRLEGAVNVGPFKLKIVPYMIDTTLTVDMEGLVVSQTDEFLVPGIQIVLGAILGAWAGPPPAPPIDILREKFKLS